MKPSLLRGAIVVGVASVALFVLLRLLSLRGDLTDAPSIARPALVAFAFITYGLTLLTFALLWRSIICNLDAARPPTTDSVAVFCASWIGRYVPSSLPYVAGKLVMGERLGHARTPLAASVLYENALVVFVGAISSSIIVPLTLAHDSGGLWLYVAAALAGAAGLTALSPPVFHRLSNDAAKLLRRGSISRDNVLSYRGIAAGSLLAAGALVLNGAVFAFILGSFVPLDPREAVAAAAIFNLAGVSGIIVVPVPSGLGIREAVLIGLLQIFVPMEIVIAAATVARLGSLAIDVVFGVAGAAIFTVRQRQSASALQPTQRRQLDAA